MTYDRTFWEQLWEKTLREHGDKVAQRPPSPHLLAEASSLTPGRALDAGCGHGAETLWLAGHGWRVTAVDFSASALEHLRTTARALGNELAARITLIEADLSGWSPEPSAFDLVVSLYVHVATTVEEALGRLASGVAPGGTLLAIGHRPIDPATGAPTRAASQTQVSLEAARAVLDPQQWQIVVAEERPRSVAGTGVDAVVVAKRRF